MQYRAVAALLSMLVLASLLAACGQQPQVIEEVTESTPVAEAPDGGEGEGEGEAESPEGEGTEESEEGGATSDVEPADEPSGESLTVPHPILSDVRVRQAIAYCTNREELIMSVYPFLDEEQRQQMLMDTFIPQGHWAHTSEGVQQYPFDPEQGQQLLEEAGWMVEDIDGPRVNADGDALSLGYNTTDAQFRVTYSTVFEQQLMDNCNIQIVRNHAPASWWFGDDTGLTVRDFELGAYAWVGQTDPAGQTLYACNQIGLPENNWEGQNFMGWCNETASEAIVAANNTLEREERKQYYAIAQQEFSKDMVSLPLFNRFEAAATTLGLQNFKPDVSESSIVANVYEWEFEDGGDTAIVGFSQEPSTMFAIVEESTVTGRAYDMISVRAATGRNYDYQAVGITELPTIEHDGASMEVVEVGEGDMVWDTTGEPVELAPGVEVVNADNETVVYEEGTLELHQITVNFEIAEGLTWEDGVPVTKEDLELAQKINCSEDTGVVSLLVCNAQESVEVTSDTSMTITYLPGARPPEYMVYMPGLQAGTTFGIGAYPAHRELSDGRTLAEVPPEEWKELPEIAQNPLSYGPYRLVEWQKGQRMIFEANPHFYLGEPPIKTIIFQFFGDTNAAVAALLNGEVDVIGTETLGAGAELETVIIAGEEGKIATYPLASATWEHVDMNLFVK